MKKYYEVVIKNLDGDWEAMGDDFTNLKNAIKYAKTIDKKSYMILDINLIIDDDLKETYNIYGKKI